MALAQRSGQPAATMTGCCQTLPFSRRCASRRQKNFTLCEFSSHLALPFSQKICAFLDPRWLCCSLSSTFAPVQMAPFLSPGLSSKIPLHNCSVVVVVVAAVMIIMVFVVVADVVMIIIIGVVLLERCVLVERPHRILQSTYFMPVLVQEFF